MKRPKRDRADEQEAAAARRREQIARALAPREQLAFTPIGAPSSARNTSLPYVGANWRDRPPGMTSGNQRERKRGNLAVLSIRIDADTLARLDEEVAANVGALRPGRSKYDAHMRSVSRSSLILDAVDMFLGELARSRQEAA